MMFGDWIRQKPRAVAAMASVICVLLALPGAVRGESVQGLSLNSETVFCLYHWMSREPMDNRDLEALSRAMGHPTYSDYKPSEMFTHNQLRRLRSNLLQIMGDFRETPEFVRILPLAGGGKNALRAGPLLPSATDYIRCELRPGDGARLERMLNGALERAGRSRSDRRAALYFKPVRVHRAGQHRNIALEAVSLPIRIVVLSPVRVEILDAGTAADRPSIKAARAADHPAGRRRS